MKKVITIAITLLVLLGLSYGVTYFTSTKFIDIAFFVGIAITVIIWFYTSKGGLTTKNTDMLVQSATGIKMGEQKYEFSPNLAFITSLAYTLITLAAMLYCYRSYF
ncbi:hypothetical protein ACFVSW_20680 [Neobacillus sp. NPDC058068]|uniref:hypothetical protein n=1 Tax=Neobacillus sp. NPDC058068 TaxID=3346325 RepID=UPI0036DCE28E